MYHGVSHLEPSYPSPKTQMKETVLLLEVMISDTLSPGWAYIHGSPLLLTQEHAILCKPVLKSLHTQRRPLLQSLGHQMVSTKYIKLSND